MKKKKAHRVLRHTFILIISLIIEKFCWYAFCFIINKKLLPECRLS